MCYSGFAGQHRVSLDPAVPEDQIDDQDQQQKATNADPASVAIPSASETTAEQEQQDQIISIRSIRAPSENSRCAAWAPGGPASRTRDEKLGRGASGTYLDPAGLSASDQDSARSPSH